MASLLVAADDWTADLMRFSFSAALATPLSVCDWALAVAVFGTIAAFCGPLMLGCAAGAGAGLLGLALSLTSLPSVRPITRRSISRSAIRASISASGTGGSAPKYRSSAARSRKYSAIAFIALKESSNPSSVHENVPYETVRILFGPTMAYSLSL